VEIKIRRLSGVLGAEITNVNVAQVSDTQFEQIHHALLRHGVIVVRGQNITPGQQVEFAKRWNALHVHPYLAGLVEHPEVIEVVKEAHERGGFGAHWHTDQIFTPAPAMATMLYAKEVPEIGGDTMFASLHAAYDALSPGMQTMLRRVRTFNQYNKSATRTGSMAGKVSSNESAADMSSHPLIRIHPETGRPALYINDMETTRHLDGMTEAESAPLLQYLLTHATRAEFTCRVNWKVGSLAIWDNRQVLHMALNDYHGQRRVMHRITIQGDVPFGLGEETGGAPCAGTAAQT
jgi:taurine dioxygenase